MGKVKTQPAPILRQKLRKVFRWVVTQNHDMACSVCTDSEPGMGQEPWEEDSCWEQGRAMVGFVSPASLEPNIQQNQLGGSRWRLCTATGRNSGEMCLQGSAGLAKRLCQHRQRILGRTWGWIPVPGLSPVGELLLLPLAQKEILHPTELLSAPLKKQRPKQRINSSSASSTSQ